MQQGVGMKALWGHVFHCACFVGSCGRGHLVSSSRMSRSCLRVLVCPALFGVAAALVFVVVRSGPAVFVVCCFSVATLGGGDPRALRVLPDTSYCLISLGRRRRCMTALCPMLSPWRTW